MTTIIYRDTGRTRSTLPASGSYVPFITRIADRWQQWRSERELESLSDDMRKDLGWPVANETNNPKATR
ncbi:hypothetical protein MOV66_03005 [Agrobacterium sp. SHOUNA12C]|uniref:DUF1127 domain-containing protein n=2 Tax=Rhizobium rhizogenes TaxID=359 RepID=B9JGF2_RHIR8|nr:MULTISPECIES: hypothetical protein [Rhizobium]ACM26927.1 hypothetical protein Arad_2837 [Rhizobium rhizogenes K84]KAA6489951.1 hypothetical protein DXT98_06115 [Agrobacterium sp. ICMP 7243]MCJ9720213.1 hypothetical protein [Agrobacterium sp. BETTINA12B]MCJ9755602.1 hypothetical protein [Agrobacterium sp. SHOUNA12C]OCJ25991.1 hypothetical protein A6U88_06070 [Agrobacterium sp. B131/95]OCJ30911.1 hypothetical protein A6U89_00425 [Agrobacterium sp. B133/95]